MLVFDSELFCIPVDEADVVELYRSTDAASLSGEDAVLPPGLAFVCVLKRDGGYQVFVAFHLKDIKRSLVYVVDPTTGSQPSFDAPLKKAFDFTEMMGFTMEAVNLKYGTAMREVVLRAIPALLSPENADRLRREREAELAELGQLVAEKPVEDSDQAGISELSPDKQVELKRAREKREEAAKAAARKLAMEKRHGEQAEAVGRAIDKILAQVNADEMVDLERAERERLMGENSALKARVGEMEQTVHRLEDQNEAVRAEAEKRIAELEEEVRLNRKEIDAGQEERKQFEKEKKEADQRLVELEEALRKAEERIKSGEADLKRAEKDRAVAEKRMAEGQQAATEARQEIESECAKRERVEKEKTAVEKKAAELEEVLQAVRHEVEAERTEKERIAKERVATEKRNAELVEEARAAKQKAGSGKEVKEEVAAIKSEAEKRIGELELAVREARELIESERFERELLVREKTAAEKRIAELELMVRQAETSSTLEKATREQVESGGAEAEKQIRELEQAALLAREQLENERTERERLENKQALAEDRVAHLERALRGAEQRIAEGRQTGSSQGEDVGKQVAELKEALQKSEDRTEFLRLEMERIAAAKAIVEKRLEELSDVGNIAVGKESESDRMPAPSPTNRDASPAPSSDGCADSSAPHIVRRPPPKGAFFHVDWDLTRIDYASPEDILEVYQSMTSVQLSLEGYPSQHCAAHIVAMKKGKSRQVHVVFGLSESRRTLVYSPAKPIRNKADYAKSISEAVKFLEVVGYMPEKMSLGKSPQAVTRSLRGIPFLSGPQKQAQGF